MISFSFLRSPISVAVSFLTSIPLAWYFRDSVYGDQGSDVDFDWTSVKPSPNLLEWVNCYDEFDCARLEVPVDWRNASNPNNVVIAIIKVPAKVESTDPAFGGTIIANPGGPGGSGVDLILWNGKDMRDSLAGDKHFEILSFDPRGVLHTIPSTSCFENALSRQVSELKSSALGTIDLAEEILNHKWASARSWVEACSSTSIGRFPDGSNMRQFVSTALVAEDMVRIIDELQIYHNSKLPTAESKSNPALLNYWGFSYGTLLGNTFASMFSHRIGRLILDGVVDAADYTATGWSANLADSMSNWATFPVYCFDAGSNCPLYNPTDPSPTAIESRIFTLLTTLKTTPIPVLNNGTADLIRYTDVRMMIFQALYFPLVRFEPLAIILADLLVGNTTSIAPFLSKLQSPDPAAPKHPVLAAWNYKLPPGYAHQGEASRAVFCGDGSPILNRTRAEHAAYTRQLLSQSPISGGFWSEIVLPCTAWSPELRPAEHNRFTGPFESKLADYDPRASPILWIGNTADPVTPLRNARKMARSHEGSVVLVQLSAGHCTGPWNPSRCTWGVARRFFAEGVLPDAGEECEGDRVPWGNGEMEADDEEVVVVSRGEL